MYICSQRNELIFQLTAYDTRNKIIYGEIRVQFSIYVYMYNLNVVYLLIGPEINGDYNKVSLKNVK